MVIAVAPIAIPINPRRTTAFPIDWCSQDIGCSSKTQNMLAESMKSPSAAASIRYSGQCVASSCAGEVFMGRQEDDREGFDYSLEAQE